MLAAWREGDEAAGVALLERSFPRLYRFFRNKLEGDVRDLVQQTLMRCVADRDRFRGEAQFSTFVYSIARFVLLEHLRAQRREFDPLTQSAIDLNPSLSEVAASSQLRGRLLEAMRRIPLDLQTIVELHYWEGLSGPQIALALEIPEGTVRSRLRRAREALADVMANMPALRGADLHLDQWMQETKPAEET